MNPAAGRDRRKRAVANLPWLAACLAFFMVGRLFPWRPKVIHAPAFQMPPVKADAVRLLDLENSNRRQINAFVGVQVNACTHFKGSNLILAGLAACMQKTDAGVN